ncbi:MAG TPA: serine/threonine-protein kinase, partial [Trebonia sp.]
MVAADVPREGNWALAGFAPGTVVAGYLLEAQIGAGGMAVVFRARDESLYRTVALKILAPALAWDEEFRERFIRESRAAAGVEHPHIIPVYAAGNADNVLYIAMRLVTGGDLSSVVRRDGPFAAGRAANLIAGIASALDTAHRSGLVHRDIKPGNILIDSVPGQPDHVYLADFGLSKGMLSTGLTGTGGFLGTPDYCSPEQITGKGIDGRTDQYALACVAYTLLAGRPPFRRDEPMAILLAHTADPPPSVVALRPDLPAAVDEVIARGLAKSPADRYGSCGEFAAALRLALEGGARHGAVPDGPARSAGPPSTLETQSVAGLSPVPGRQPDGLSWVPGFPVGGLDASRPERTGNPVAPGSASGPASVAEPPDQHESAGAFDTTRVFSTLEPAGQAARASLEPEPATDPFARPRPRRRVSRRVAVASVSAVAVVA